MIRHLLKVVWNRKRANALIVAEIFVSFLVLFAVITAAVGFAVNWREPIGFAWRDVWNVRMELGEPGDRDAEQHHATVLRMLDELESMPEVESAAAANTPAYSFSTSEQTYERDGRVISYTYDEVSDEYAEVMRLKVLYGRWFNASDEAAQLRPVVLDTNLARTIFGREDVAGQNYELNKETTVRVVGVIAPFRKDGEPSSPMNMMFRRVARNGSHGSMGSNLLVRVHPGTPARFEEELVKRLEQVAPNVSFRVRHMSAMRDNMLRMKLAPLVAGGIVGSFLIAMVTLGLTGVLWQNVTRRTREIGLRRAMGATGGSVHRQILAEVVLLATFAVVVGSVIVLQLPILGAMKLVSPSAFAIGFGASLATIYLLTVLCGLYPSWLASRLQPADALRYE